MPCKTLYERLLISAFMVLCAALASCSSGNVKPDQVILQNSQNAGNPMVAKYNMQIAAGGMQEMKGRGPMRDYKIGPEDLLDINVFEVKEMTAEVRVSGNGYIGMPLAGQIKAAGLTASQLETCIEKKLKRYLQEPTVSVFVKEYRSQPISVLGAVKFPKVYYVTGQMHLLDVLSMAGGLTPDAGNVCIVQKSSGPGHGQKQTVIDLEQLLAKGHAELNIPIYTGEIVNVPAGGTFFVDGAVKAPGAFPIRGKTTITQAITMAKGLEFEAVKSDIKIFRDTGQADRKVIAVNYESIMKGKTPDIMLQDKDVIVVPKNGFRALIKGLSTTIGIGSFSLGKGF